MLSYTRYIIEGGLQRYLNRLILRLLPISKILCGSQDRNFKIIIITETENHISFQQELRSYWCATIWKYSCVNTLYLMPYAKNNCKVGTGFELEFDETKNRSSIHTTWRVLLEKKYSKIIINFQIFHFCLAIGITTCTRTWDKLVFKKMINELKILSTKKIKVNFFSNKTK